MCAVSLHAVLRGLANQQITLFLGLVETLLNESGMCCFGQICLSFFSFFGVLEPIRGESIYIPISIECEKMCWVESLSF